ncbi:MAG: DJ-1/PfpI family protein [Eubacterium sp.]|jgi:4-methyl-5(b-hydroxyethyl)-thiazole monophosphate biosynthesis|nr:DJ-1/PfpI family protein [Eubacterium sp.]
MVYLFLANGFEEIEAITPLDILRRAGKKVVTVGIGKKLITGAHGIVVETDITDGELSIDSFSAAMPEMIVLPGGMPGTQGLKENKTVNFAIKLCNENNIYIAAICAAPSILGEMGILSGKRAVCFPGYEKNLKGAIITNNFVEQDGNIITAKGAGVSLDFSLKLVEILAGSEKAAELYVSMQCNYG